MKNIFIIACKLIGLLQLYWSFATLMQIGFAMSATFSAAANDRMDIVTWLSGTILSSALSFFVAYLLIFKSEAIARFVRVPDDKTALSIPAEESALRIGILLLGLYFLLGSIPRVTRDIADAIRYIDGPQLHTTLLKTAGSVGQVILALFVILKPKKVLNYLTR